MRKKKRDERRKGEGRGKEGGRKVESSFLFFFKSAVEGS